MSVAEKLKTNVKSSMALKKLNVNPRGDVEFSLSLSLALGKVKKCRKNFLRQMFILVAVGPAIEAWGPVTLMLNMPNVYRTCAFISNQHVSENS